MDLLTLTAVELQGLLSRHVVTSVDITARYLDQIEKHNHAGLNSNAVISTAPKETVLEYAKQLDEERQRGAVRGPFHGALSQANANANAKVVDKLIAAGMIIIAKANLSVSVSTFTDHRKRPALKVLGMGKYEGF